MLFRHWYQLLFRSVHVFDSTQSSDSCFGYFRNHSDDTAKCKTPFHGSFLGLQAPCHFVRHSPSFMAGILGSISFWIWWRHQLSSQRVLCRPRFFCKLYVWLRSQLSHIYILYIFCRVQLSYVFGRERLSERSFLIVGVCDNIFTSSHLHICSSSHLFIFTPVHLHIFSSSHLFIFTSVHLHIFSSSHLLIFTSSHLLIFTSSHLHVFSSSLLFIFTSVHLHILASTHPHIFSSSHLLIFSTSHLHIFSSSHLHILTSSDSLLTPCSLALMLSCPLAPSFFSISLLKARGSANETARNATLSHEMRFDRPKLK